MSSALTGQGPVPPLPLEWSRSLSYLAPGSTWTTQSLLFASIGLTKAILPAPLPSFYFSPGILCHLVLPVTVKWGGRVGGIKGACPALDQGRNPAGGWLPVSGVTWPEARDPHRSPETIIISGWSLVQYVDFFLLCMSNAIINVLREKKKERLVLGFRCGHISPVKTFISITWSAWQSVPQMEIPVALYHNSDIQY